MENSSRGQHSAQNSVECRMLSVGSPSLSTLNPTPVEIIPEGKMREMGD